MILRLAPDHIRRSTRGGLSARMRSLLLWSWLFGWAEPSIRAVDDVALSSRHRGGARVALSCSLTFAWIALSGLWSSFGLARSMVGRDSAVLLLRCVVSGARLATAVSC
jgi:hypothetical protein